MYNYYEAVLEDVKEAIKNNYDVADYDSRDEMEEALNEGLWIDDSVTGNGSGSYTFNTYQAEENLAHNWDEIELVASEFGFEPVVKSGYEYGPEWWDVSIRCYYLGQAISEALDDMETEGLFDESNEIIPDTLTA